MLGLLKKSALEETFRLTPTEAQMNGAFLGEDLPIYPNSINVTEFDINGLAAWCII
jgi:hypothetical protein